MNRRTCYVFLLAGVLLAGDPRTGVALQPCNTPLPDLFHRVSPSVVFVSALSIDPFKVGDRLKTSMGSGFVLEDGLILANSHVVSGSRYLTVTLDGGQVVGAKVVAQDPILDVALLQLAKTDFRLSAVRLGDSDKVRVGEDVLVVGNPVGLEQTLTAGVVSGINPILPVVPMNLKLPLIQTDAAINPANSGGPLLNRCGEVIGVCNSIVGEGGNLGFAIPINLVKEVLAQLKDKGRVDRPWVGVNGQLVTKDLGEMLHVPLVDGFLVETVEFGSPASEAGLRGGNLPVSIAGKELLLGGYIITHANGKPLNNPKDFSDFVRALKVGDEVTFSVFYEGETREESLKLTEYPE